MQYRPRGAAFLGDGKIVVCDDGIPGIVHIHSQCGQRDRPITPGRFSVHDVAHHTDCLYITECNTPYGSVFVYDKEGNHKQTVKVGYKGIGGIAVTDRAIFVTSSEDNSVYKLDMPAGSNKQVFVKEKDVLIRCPSYIASDGRHVCVSSSNNNNVFLFDMNGVVKYVYGGRGAGPGQLNFPRGVLIDARGRVLICDRDNHRICIVSTDGKHLQSVDLIKDGLKRPVGLALSSTGKLVVTCNDSKRLVIYDTNMNK